RVFKVTGRDQRWQHSSRCPNIFYALRKLNNPIAQLTVVTSGAYSGGLEPYLIRSESRMMPELSSNMVCLNIKLAQYIISSQRI
ncbi:hypothetical protein RZR72_25070, partial [Enterobacter asburiae]|nr:hypothetical protein [Enterobacter asburiae]